MKIEFDKVLTEVEMKAAYGAFYNKGVKAPVDSEVVPESVKLLIPYAQFWGNTDDGERFELLTQATEEIKSNLSAIVGMYDDELDEWLAGAEATSKSPSNSYLAFSAMRMVADFI